MFRPDTKAAPADLETKSSIVMGNVLSFPEFLASRGEHQLSAYTAITLYEQAMPLFNAIDIRATAFSEIPIKLYDKKKKEYIDDHPVLELLAAPNADMSQLEFLHALSSFYDITGEAFLVATGRANKEPVEIMNVSPVNVGFTRASTMWGLLNVPETIYIQNRYSASRNYKATDDQGRLRFINGSEDGELWHLRAFNPRRGDGNFRGMSKARSVWLEVQQYLSGNRTNLSMLKRGTRLSMAWVNNSEHELTSTQWERMQAEAQKYSGEENAGGTPILDGMDVKTIQQTNRDMEFGKLQDSMLSRISNVYDVPLALLLADTMTLSNLETAVLHLYDMGVLPHAKRMYSELTRFLLPRYKDGENLEFRYNETDISAVRTRLIENAKRQKEVGVNTINELREMVGDEPRDEDGTDTLFVAGTMKPLDQAIKEPDPIPAPVAAPAAPGTETRPDEEEEEQEEEERSAYQEFVSKMVSLKDESGERKYTDMEIVELALEKGLLNGN